MSQSDTAPARRTPPTFVPRAFTASWMLGCGVFLLAPLSAAKAGDEQTQPAHTHKAGLSRHVPRHALTQPRPHATPARSTQPQAPSAHRTLDAKSVENLEVSSTGGLSVLNPGTRAHSTASVSIVTGEQLTATGQTNVLQALGQISPAITVPTQGGLGGSALVQTMSLRGLSSDDTLILVNGHRRHIGANFNVNAGPNWGTDPADISQIPISAIDHIEVITEGASALYGQDAIAGAVNIVLKRGTSKGNVTFQNSGYYAGDGQALDGYANYGFALGHNGGYLNLAAQVVHQLPTNRSGDYIGTLYADPEKNATASKDVQRSQGIKKATQETLSENMEIPLGQSGFSLYSTTTFGHRISEVAEAYRATVDSLTLTNLYPSGMQPYLAMDEYDFETDNGIHGRKWGFSWDAYINYGRDNQRYTLKDTDNPSLGAGTTQTRFYEGASITSELSTGLRASRRIETGFLPQPISLSFGAEYRHDDFQMTEGEPNSWYGYGATDHGGNGPGSVTYQNRDVYEGNVNLDFHVTPKWEWTLGGRAASYTNMATVATGSVGTRYNFNKRWAIRANINTGYRPPTLASMYYYYNSVYATYTTFNLPVDSDAARALGAGNIKGEYSRSFSIGLDAEPVDNFHITGNLYYIAINDRLASTTTLSGPYVSSVLADAGLVTSNSIGYASYFTNPVNTGTYGGDFAADYKLDTRRAGHFLFRLGLNFSDTEIRSHNAVPSALRACRQLGWSGMRLVLPFDL